MGFFGNKGPSPADVAQQREDERDRREAAKRQAHLRQQAREYQKIVGKRDSCGLCGSAEC